MTDDLLYRLRGVMCGDDPVLEEAANRIEQLEKGFVDILSQQPLDLLVAMIAKACLVGAIDKNGKYCFVGNLKIVDGKPLMEKKDGLS
jgi:hypothetical protein